MVSFSFGTQDTTSHVRLSCILKELVTAADLNPSSFSSHSFRIGAATTAAATGHPDWLLWALGRWKSDICLQRSGPIGLHVAFPQITHKL